MSGSRFEGLGLGLLLLPAGLLFIVLAIGGLFLTAHDTPSSRYLSTADQPVGD